MIWLQNIIVTLSAVPFVFIVREGPKTPASALVTESKLSFDFWKDSKALFTNCNYILIVIPFTFLFGNLTIVGNILGPLFSAYGYTPVQDSIFGIVFLFTGVIYSMIVGILLDKYKRFTLMLKICATGTTLTALPLLYTLQKLIFGLALINIACLGFFILSIIPISYSLSVEVTHPTNPALVNGILISIAQIWASLGTIGLAGLAPKHPQITVGIIMITGLIATIAACFVKEDLRRLRATE